MIILVRKKFLCAAVSVLLAGTLCTALRPVYVPAGLVSAPMPPPCYIIDAGHGGEDGGAVAEDGTVESEINLAVAKRVEMLLGFMGAETSMTRRDEYALYDAEAGTLREKKRSDLHNRVAAVNAAENATLISIHQNALPSDKSVHGAQVFFASAMGSENLAEAVQKVLNQAINTDNAKKEKKVAPSIYLMNHVNCRAVLVECGFLSNAEEAKLLATAEHQTRLAAAITAGILQADYGRGR